MHPVVHDYTAAREGLKSLIPPMPDLYVRQADGVYAFQPLTANGRRFLEERDELYQADELRVQREYAMVVFDDAFDAGLAIV